MFEGVGGGLVVECPDDARRVVGREIADDLGEVGGVQPRQPVLGDRELDLRGVEIVQRRDVVPGDQRARDPRDDGRRDAAPAEAAHDPADPDVGGDQPQRAAGARDLDVVDAHDLAAVDVDDLFVEEILDEIERFVLGGHVGGRRFAQHDAAVVVEFDYRRDRGHLPAPAGFDDDRVDVRERVLGMLHHEVGDAADGLAFTSASHDRRAAEHFREEAFVKRHVALGVRSHGGGHERDQTQEHHAAVHGHRAVVQRAEGVAVHVGPPAERGDDRQRFVRDQSQRHHDQPGAQDVAGPIGGVARPQQRGRNRQGAAGVAHVGEHRQRPGGERGELREVGDGMDRDRGADERKTAQRA